MLIRISVFLLMSILTFTPFLYADNESGLIGSGYGITGYSNIENLLQKPEKIATLAIKEEFSGLTVLNSDYHMLSDISVEELSSLLVDLDNASKLFDRIIYSKDLTQERSINYPHIQEVHTSYKFLGIGAEYKYKVRVYFDKVTSSEFAMRWELYDAMDSSLAALTGTWYLKEIYIEGRRYTYIRSYASTRISGQPPGILFFTRTFGEGEIKRTFRNLLNKL